MTTDAKCTLQITGWDEKTYQEIEGRAKLSNAKVTQSYSGAIEGSSSWKDKLEKMVAETIKAEQLSGNALLESVAQKLSKIDEEIRYPSTTGGCFAKGTRVHTKEGLKRIEEIKVGDYVLSSPEDGTGGADYKRVLNVFVHKDKTIRHITGYGPNNDEPYFLAATGNHPFWVEGVGWTRADELKPDDVLRKADGRFTDISRQRPVYRTQQEGVGWVQELTDVEGSYGTLFDYANYAVVPDDGKAAYLSDEVYASDDPYLKVDVYNLEVEDYHTYYVSGVGVWVHNKMCLGVELSNGNGVDLPRFQRHLIKVDNMKIGGIHVNSKETSIHRRI